jgi:diadenylate cyclase
MDNFLGLASQLFTWQSALDILLVTLVLYTLLRLFAGTQAVQLLRGLLIIFLIIALLSSFSGLIAFSWLVRTSSLAILIALPVIFQPELRRALERVGRTDVLFGRQRRNTGYSVIVSEVIAACQRMATQKIGAIIVFEDRVGLEMYVEKSVIIDAAINRELLITIFYPGTPLHDGAVLIRKDRVVAAASVLPLTQRILPDATLGTRHRAALGITEDTDALALVVSEETGSISAAWHGGLARPLDEKRLRRILERFYEARRDLFEGIETI